MTSPNIQQACLSFRRAVEAARVASWCTDVDRLRADHAAHKARIAALSDRLNSIQATLVDEGEGRK